MKYLTCNTKKKIDICMIYIFIGGRQLVILSIKGKTVRGRNGLWVNRQDVELVRERIVCHSFLFMI
jgi:predicted ATP-grasp superfamily ATP-dependent carboligase